MKSLVERYPIGTRVLRSKVHVLTYPYGPKRGIVVGYNRERTKLRVLRHDRRSIVVEDEENWEISPLEQLIIGGRYE